MRKADNFVAIGTLRVKLSIFLAHLSWARGSRWVFQIIGCRSFVCRLWTSYNKQHPLLNHLVGFHQTWQEWSLGGPLSKLFKRKILKNLLVKNYWADLKNNLAQNFGLWVTIHQDFSNYIDLLKKILLAGICMPLASHQICFTCGLNDNFNLGSTSFYFPVLSLNFFGKFLIERAGLEVIKKKSYSTQLSMNFILLINVKMPTIVGILF